MAEETSTLLAVAVGASIPILGALLTTGLTFWRDERQWKRQERAAKEKEVAEQEKATKERVQEIYLNCMRCLTYLSAQDVGPQSTTENGLSKDEPLNEEQVKRLEEAQQWVILFQQHCVEAGLFKDTDEKSFQDYVSGFLSYPRENASSLRKHIDRVAREDKTLYPQLSTQEETPASKRFVTVYIRSDFRKAQFVTQVEVPKYHRLQFTLADLSESQRRKLWDAFTSFSEMPQSFTLPLVNSSGTSTGGFWEASLNPLTTPVKEVFDAWEKYYDQAAPARNTQIGDASTA